MTTETERRVPEHPGWQPWWLRYAEYEGSTLMLLDVSEYGAYWLTERAPNGGSITQTYPTLPDAEAAFELACERLREGG